MISEQDRNTIVDLAKKYSVRKVLLFGSASDADFVANDIDVGVSGVNPRDFIKLLGEAMWLVSKPLDLVDLDQDTKFTRMIKESGIILYERPAG
jgi:predicted nucleotidyltransferase